MAKNLHFVVCSRDVRACIVKLRVYTGTRRTKNWGQMVVAPVDSYVFFTRARDEKTVSGCQTFRKLLEQRCFFYYYYFISFVWNEKKNTRGKRVA